MTQDELKTLKLGTKIMFRTCGRYGVTQPVNGTLVSIHGSSKPFRGVCRPDGFPKDGTADRVVHALYISHRS